jgi:hypothetical protein
VLPTAGDGGDRLLSDRGRRRWSFVVSLDLFGHLKEFQRLGNQSLFNRLISEKA